MELAFVALDRPDLHMTGDESHQRLVDCTQSMNRAPGRVKQFAGFARRPCRPGTPKAAAPGWWDGALGDGVVLDGGVLGTLGLPMPVLGPQQALVLHLVAEPVVETGDALPPAR